MLIFGLKQVIKKRRVSYNWQCRWNLDKQGFMFRFWESIILLGKNPVCKLQAASAQKPAAENKIKRRKPSLVKEPKTSKIVL